MTSHAAASYEDNALRLWSPGLASADADLLPERGTLVSRSRDLRRNHGVAQGAEQTVTDNVIGTGLRLSARPMYKLLGKDKEWAREWGRTAQDFFGIWAGDTACDACDELDFAGLTAQVTRSLWTNGEACALPMWMPEPGCLFSTKILLIEPDQLCNPNGQPDTPLLRAGIERTAYGRPVAAHVSSTHPGDRLGLGLGAAAPRTWARIPMRTPWGRKRFIHVHDKDRSGQTRGKPIIAAVMKQFKMADHYQVTELQAAIVNAMIAAFITTPLDQESLVELFGGDAQQAQEYLDRRESTVKLKGGAIIPLNPGDQLQAFTPSRPAAGFDAFMTSIYRQAAAGLNMPYELLMKDFSRTNYSSARAAMLEAWRYFNGLRKRVGTMFCQEAYLLVLEEMVDRRMIEAPDFYSLQRAYAASRWIGPGRGWVDPVKEADAAKIRIDNNVSTLEIECAEQGLDWEEVLEQKALEKARMDELGLTPASAPAGPRAPYPSDAEDSADTTQDGGDGNAAEQDNATEPAAPADAGA